MKFTKPSLSIADQIALLQRRGMVVSDLSEAAHSLQHISYYRLRAYWLPFEQSSDIEGDHSFRSGTKFSDALSLYSFDRQLRLLVLNAIERIEVSLRGSWSHHLARKYGPHGYLDPAIYNRADHYAKAFSTLLDEIGRSKDTFMSHYKHKYGDPEQPPIWMTAEVISLGQLSKWLGNLKFRADRQAIARPYEVDEKVLVSIAHHLTYIRNICAHHGRLWNKQFTVTMIIPNSPPKLQNTMSANANRRIYNTLSALAYLVEVVAPNTHWKEQLSTLMSSCEFLDERAMGFPSDWRDRSIWL